MSFRALAVLAAVAVTAVGVTDAGAVPSGDVVLFNPSVSATSPRVTWLVGPQVLAPAESKRILDAVFPGGHLADLRQCPPDECQGRAGCREPEFADLRRAGRFAPSVFQAASGSFTRPSRSQTLYLITNGECGATPLYAPGTITLAVVEAGVVAALAVVEDGHTSIQDVVDVDGDGRAEVLLATAFTNQGITVVSARLVRLFASGLAVVRDFGQVLESNCGGGPGPMTQTYSIVHAVTAPGAAVTFRLEKRTEACSAQ